MSTEVVLAGACRTPIGKMLGGLTGYSAPELGALVVRETLSRTGIAPEAVDEVLMGHVIQAGTGQNPARQAALGAGIPPKVAAMTVNKVCGSGLKAVMLADQAIRTGHGTVLVAGGMESMSNAPHLAPKSREGYRLGTVELLDAMMYDGLRDAFSGDAMGTTGDICAREHGISREEADAFALRSHELAHKATEGGHFKDEIVPVEARPPGRVKEPDTLERDEGIRPGSTLEKLATLRPVFDAEGFVTAGNASQISDGASALVVTTRAYAEEHGLDVQGVVRGYGTAGVEPERVMSAPIPGTRQLMEQLELTVHDIDLFEHNEAFASASCAVRKAIEIPDEKFNVTGGAVALGHPLGASGARVLTTLLHNMERLGKDRGLATLCLGGGNSVQMVVERG